MTQGRVFAMTKQDVDASNDVVSGTLSLFSKEAKVLFDSGATHSFVSSAFASHAGKMVEPLDYQLSIATPLGNCVLIGCAYKSCVVSFDGRDFLIDLFTFRNA